MSQIKIVFSGGGTLGPVTPLLAIANAVQKKYPDAAFSWLGTNFGPERMLVEEHHIRFTSIPAGKLRRYFSVFNFFDLFNVAFAFFISLAYLWKENPDVCVSAGGFVSVPVHMAAWCLGISTWIHQQDVDIGFANRLMTPYATLITTALEEQVTRFPKGKTRWLGNPVRSDIFAGSTIVARQIFSLNTNLPVVFATGGGTGSLRVNQMVVEAVQHLQGVCEIIHLSGKERPVDAVNYAAKIFPHYHAYQFFTDEMKEAYAVASIVVSRGGFGTLTEVAALKKAAILIPKPGHQEANVGFLSHGGAAILLDERTTSGYHLATIIKTLLLQNEAREEMGERLHGILPPAKESDLVAIIERFAGLAD
jgi:UDP-N-acetylglucosamine--N-acetylmuramyl-(pentapeptide) pyrophosphoryl-undecaprenol N-acetylglucosamine transferase